MEKEVEKAFSFRDFFSLVELKWKGKRERKERKKERVRVEYIAVV